MKRPASRPSASQPSALKVLFIVGAGRSGSTLLARALGALDGYFCPGEPYYLWKEGPVEDRLCECGQPFSRCSYWIEVMASIATVRPELVARSMERLRHRIARTRHLPFLLFPPLRQRRLDALEEYGAALETLYQAMAEHADARVLVDASKLPSQALVLRRLPGIQLYVLHLVRDPRGVVNSWRRQRFNPASGAAFRKMAAFKASTLWAAWNLAAEVLLRRPEKYLRVRYEDWVDDPASILAHIVDLTQMPTGQDPPPGRTLHIPKGHTLGGNPGRFSATEVQLREDLGWRSELSRRLQWAVTALLWPLMLRYGYIMNRRSTTSPG